MLLLVAAVTGIVVACKSDASEPTTAKESGAEFTAEDVKRGQYLVNAMGCDDCHSPKVMGPHGPEVDTALRLSGYRANVPPAKVDTGALKSWVLFGQEFTNAVGVWGMSFAANLTSDESGIGNWSFEQFKKAIREGKYKGLDNGRPLLPPMPWPQYRNLSDDDLRGIFAFLKSTKPVSNVVPAPIPPTQLNK
jgi:cytochrome c553